MEMKALWSKLVFLYFSIFLENYIAFFYIYHIGIMNDTKKLGKSWKKFMNV
jgi:hypothetical protein